MPTNPLRPAHVMILAAATLLLVPRARAHAQSVDGLSGQFTAGATTCVIPPAGLLVGLKPPVSIPSFTGLCGIYNGTTQLGSMTVAATDIQSSTQLNRGGQIVTFATGSVGTTKATLQAVGSTQPALQIVAGPLSDGSKSLTYCVGPLHGCFTSFSGSASLNQLTITGPLVGGQTLTYTGTPSPNTVLYSNPAVTITLNAQNTTGQTECTTVRGETTCSFVITGLTTQAVLVTFTGTPLSLGSFSGTFAIGESGFPG